MNTTAPAPSKATMQSLIDTSIIPDPYKPVVGDVYGREPSARVDGLPLRVVVLELREDPEYDAAEVVLLEDGREETQRNLPAYLASVHGIEPMGRVRAQDGAAATSDTPVADLERRLAEAQNEAAQLRRDVDRLIAEKHAAT